MSLLRVDQLARSFGGVHAIQDLSFDFEAGAIYAVIGPNGAGKTTLFNLVTGLYQPTSGQIFLQDREITGNPPHKLAGLGLCRTFQNLQVCMNMSAVENVMVGRHLHLNTGLLSTMLRLPGLVKADRDCRQKSTELMESVGIGDYIDSNADAMPYGALKRLEIARALAAQPTLLLLDEPAAGLNPKETADIDVLIRQISAQGVTVILVEHDMKLVMGTADHILVLDYGKKLAEGSAAEIRANPDVIAAYLGGAEKQPGDR